jgi:TonB family protein
MLVCRRGITARLAVEAMPSAMQSVAIESAGGGDAPLAAFVRDHRRVQVAASSRIAAGLLTTALFALLVFLATHRMLWMAPEHPPPSEIITRLLPNVAIRKFAPVPPPFLAHFIKPRAEVMAPPAFTVATAAPPAPLPVSAATSSPLTGGTPDSTAGAGGSASGTSGNGRASSACWDFEWAMAINKRIGQFFQYPPRAAKKRVTGVVEVRMLIRRSGWLDREEILKSSGDADLDNAAYQAVLKAQPLPRIPDRMHADRIDAEIPIVFGPRGDFTPTQGSCN